MITDLTGRKAVVSGSAGGIGRAIARGWRGCPLRRLAKPTFEHAPRTEQADNQHR
jgi:NAD(P)-dependent dehydrogenase (short-subunit alcohol dehydrogenase family)